ncbi:6286_t:CDS:1, partial [Paraglomus occultum]
HSIFSTTSSSTESVKNSGATEPTTKELTGKPIDNCEPTEPDYSKPSPSIAQNLPLLKKLSKNRRKQLEKRQTRNQLAENLFDEFYTAQYDTRWPPLLAALRNPHRYCAMTNKYACQKSIESYLPSDAQQVPFLDIPCYISNDKFTPPTADGSGITIVYHLDASSVLATKALDVQPDDNILDMCAGPGGKTLSILQRLSHSGYLTSNEPSVSRRVRLQRVINNYIPPSMLHRVTVISSVSTYPPLFDKVIADVPCSNERHLLQNETEFVRWNDRHSKKLLSTQYTILWDSIKMVKIGGIVVYSTCSINKCENDGVIEKFLDKSRMNIEIVRREYEVGESTDYGWIVLPDKSDGWGPLYFCVLKKLNK